MPNKSENTKIEAFWKWFIANEAHIKEALDDEFHPERENLVRSMDNHILGFGLFTWEMGPTSSNGFYLTISPNTDHDLLIISKAIMAAAPQLKDWTFYYAKPIKEGDLVLNLYDEEFSEHQVDAMEWKFVLSPAANNKIDIRLEAPNMAALDKETQTEAANLVVSNLLGEELRMRLVRKIDVVRAFDTEEHKQAAPIDQLSRHF